MGIQSQIESKKQIKPDFQIRDTDIVADEDQVILIYARDRIRLSYFLIGDIANKYIYDSATHTGFRVTAKRACQAVGRFCGKSPRTVRYYAETAAFFPKGIRAEFEVLPFSFFTFARSIPEHWMEILEYAVNNPSITLGHLRSHFLEKYAQEQQEKNNLSCEGCADPLHSDSGWESDDCHPSLSCNAEESTQEKSRAESGRVADFTLSLLLSAISDLLDKIGRIIGYVTVPQESKEKLESGISSIRSALPAIANSIEKERAETE